jgi:predicted CXXCH cytochrome family protein
MRLRQAAATIVIVLSWTTLAAAQSSQAPADFVWAAACKDCHAAQYSAWQETKHARAIMRLTVEEREGAKCVGCHVTGATALAADAVNANVQCEACHGAGRAHMQGDPKAITRKPSEGVCVRCHTDASPKFKYFAYSSMSPLAHPVRK